MKHIKLFEESANENSSPTGNFRIATDEISSQLERLIADGDYQAAREYTIEIENVINKYMNHTTLGWKVKPELQK